ncbi:MAG: 4Fe-4S dicluster domain-containing protein [Clostridiales bacterium]|nr:4Fe-4S dicluster domain-containing protein [Clostridiales bacterium]
MTEEKLSIIEALKTICEDLFSKRVISRVLAFTEGEIKEIPVVSLITNPEGLKGLKWDESCNKPLAKLLLGLKPKTAIIARPYDARAVVMYINENQLKRDDVFIIGVGKDASDFPVFDAFAKDPSPLQSAREPSPSRGSLDFFLAEIDRCILCYACRQACWGCYCPSCFMERGIPDWTPAGVGREAKIAFHLGRTMHLAGRCVECGGCKTACPSGVNLKYLIDSLTQMCYEEYGHKAGMEEGARDPLSDYRCDDGQPGFLE